MRVSCTFVLLAVCFAAQSQCAPLDPLSIIPNVPVAGSLLNNVPSVPGLDILSGLPVVGPLSSRDLHDITKLDSLKSLPDALPAVNNLSSVTGSDGPTPISALGDFLPVVGDSLPALKRDLSGLRSPLPTPTLPGLGGSSPVSGLGGFLPSSALPTLPGLGGSSPIPGPRGMLPLPSSGSFPVAGSFLPFRRDLGAIAPALNVVPLDSTSGITKMVGLDSLPALPETLVKRGLIDLDAPLRGANGLPIISSVGKPSELISSIPHTGSALPITSGLPEVKALDHLSDTASPSAVPSELLHPDVLSQLTGVLGSN